MSTADEAVAHVPHVGSPLAGFVRKPMNWLLLFIPLTVGLEQLTHVAAPVLFFLAALAIVPIAAQIVSATEQLATRTGDAIGGLLNATFGNAPELIIAFVALRAGYLEMVRASRWKRASRSGSPARCSGRTLMATVRPRRVSAAL